MKKQININIIIKKIILRIKINENNKKLNININISLKSAKFIILVPFVC
jgi:hypothetical protein